MSSRSFCCSCGRSATAEFCSPAFEEASPRFYACGIMLLTRRQNELRGNFLQGQYCTNVCRQRSIGVQCAAYEFCFKNLPTLPKAQVRWATLSQ